MFVNQHLDSGATVQYVPAARGSHIPLMPPTGNQQQVVGNKVDVAPGNQEVALTNQQVMFHSKLAVTPLGALLEGEWEGSRPTPATFE